MSKKKRKKGQAVALSARAPEVFADTAKGAAVLKRADLGREIGVAGTLWAGYAPFDSYNPNLQGPLWCGTVDEMRRCGPITAVELCITIPPAETEWRVDGESRELVELVERCLFTDDGLSTTWSDVVRRACMSAMYGTWLFEIVWGQAEGALVWRRLADRLPASIYGYDLAEDRGLAAVRQRGQAPGLGAGWVDVAIPVEKLLLFPYRMEGANWHGISILRGAYIHWYCCQMLYRIANTGVEHNLLGIPAISLPGNYTTEDRETALAMLTSVYRHESSALVLPPGWELLDTSHLGNGSIDTLPLIEHHRNELFRAALVSWVLGGETAYSNQAGVDAMMHFGLIVWNFLAKSVADVFNRHGLPRIVRLNTGRDVKPADMPKLIPADIAGLLRLQSAAEFIGALSQGGFLRPDGELEDENFFRAGLGMPERALEVAALQPPPTAPPWPPQAGADPAAPPPAAPPHPAIGFADPAPVMEALEQNLAEATDAWQRAGQAVLAEVLEDLLRQLAGGTAVAEIAVSAEVVADYADWIGEWLVAVWEEAGSDVPPPESLGSRARVIAADHAQAARVEVQRAALEGASPEEIAGRYGEAMGRRLRVDLERGDGHAAAVAEETVTATSSGHA